MTFIVIIVFAIMITRIVIASIVNFTNIKVNFNQIVNFVTTIGITAINVMTITITIKVIIISNEDINFDLVD